MKRLLLLIFSFTVSGLFGLTYNESFDTVGNWGGGAAGAYNSKTYIASGEIATFSGDLCIRQSSGTQDGFPSARSGAYSWRLRNAAGTNWEAKIESGGVSTFSVWVRRWDDSPGVDFNCEFSTDNGSTWTNVVNITNTWLGNTSDWSQINGTINASNGAGATDDIIIRITRSGGERLMIDDFEVTDFVGGPTISTSLSSVTSLDYVEGDPNGSTPQSFAVSATGFAASSTIGLAAPTNFLISTTSVGGYGSTINLTTDGSGDLSSTNIYVILQAGLPVSNYGLSDLDITGPSATTVSVALSGSVTANFVNFSVAAATASETAGTHVITVTTGIAGTHTIEVVATAAGTAVDPTHYSYTTQTVSFVGVTSQTISVTLNDNIICEGDVNVVFELQNAVNCSIGAMDSHDLTITDDEQTFIPIDFQGFEGGGWAYTANPAPYNVSGDIWNEVTSVGSISALSGSNLWGMRDLENTNGGGPGDHTLTFSKNISSYSDVEISFDWTVDGYESADVLRYEIWHDGVLQGSTNLCASGSACTAGWTQETVIVPNSVNMVELRLIANQNGDADYAGFDDVTISGLDCSTCSEPTIASVFSASSPTGITTTSADISWNLGGDGDNHIVLMRLGSAVTASPMDLSTYSANSVFGLGDLVGTNNYVVYNGNGNSVTVTGLTPGVEYFIEVFDYNCLPGAEDYLTSSSSTDSFLVRPEPAENFSEGCVTASTIELSWADPLSGTHDGFLLVGRAGNPEGVASAIDPNTQTFNQDFTLAPIYGVSSRVLYNGVGNSVTISGLTEGTNYTFELYSYAVTADGLGYIYTSTLRSTSEDIYQMDVPTYGGFAGDTQVTLNWTLPPGGCWDEVMVIADNIMGVNQSPSGDGSAYTHNTIFGSGTAVGPPAGFVVYEGLGTTVNVTNLINTTSYSFEIYVRNGTDWSQGKDIVLTPSNATVLFPGDLAIVSFNTNVSTPGANNDEICFVAFEDINESTSIDITDNGYERAIADFWGGGEGVVRFQRTGGGTIAAGTTICFESYSNTPNTFHVYVCGVQDDANWTISSINGLGIFNTNGSDQFWIMQGGAWTGGFPSQSTGSYSGNVLYGWTATGWDAMPGYNSTSGSTLFPGSKCFTTDLNGVGFPDKVKYTGPLTVTSKLDWISRVNDVSNWTGYNTNGDYIAGGPDYIGSCINFPLSAATITDGVWTGLVDDQWFECGNWSDLRVPTSASDVQIDAVTNDAVIDETHPDASIYGSIAEVNNLTIDGTVEVFDAADQLVVNGDLYIENNASLINQDGGNIEIFGNLELIGANSVFDMNSPTTASTLTLHGDWVSGALGGVTNGFIENNSLVDFVGTGTQLIDCYSLTSGTETFYDVEINKPSGKVELAGCDMTVSNVLNFGSGGFIDAATDDVKVIVTNTATTAITGYEAPNATGIYPVNDGFVEGRLERAVLLGIYDFPVGDRPAGFGYNPVNMNITVGTGAVSAIFDPASPGVMNVYDNTQLCGTTQRILDYEEFANDGYWNLNGPGTMEYTVTMHPNMGSNPPFAPPPNNEYKLMRAPGGTAGDVTNVWPWASAYETDICVFTDYYAASGSFTGFSDFAIQGDILDPVLPIELLYFEAKNQDRDIEVSWVTATEINNNLFKLYHSRDGIEWEEIDVQNGAGTTSIEQSYSFLHKNPAWGLHYYQLQQIDFDGTATMSDIDVAEIGSNDDITVYPVPASDVLFIDVEGVLDARSIRVNNEKGQLISGWILDNNRLNIERLNSGVYFITFIGQENTVVKKFIKISAE